MRGAKKGLVFSRPFVDALGSMSVHPVEINQIIKVTEKWHKKIHTNERISLFNKDVHILGMSKPSLYHLCSHISAI